MGPQCSEENWGPDVGENMPNSEARLGVRGGRAPVWQAGDRIDARFSPLVSLTSRPDVCSASSAGSLPGPIDRLVNHYLINCWKTVFAGSLR